MQSLHNIATDAIRNADYPAKVQKLTAQNRKTGKIDWKQLKEVIMTRGIYIKCRTHPEAANALLATEQKMIIENSQFDYFSGCGRDGRGRNNRGKILSQSGKNYARRYQVLKGHNATPNHKKPTDNSMQKSVIAALSGFIPSA